MADGSEQRHPNLDEHHRNVIEQLENIIGNSLEEAENFHAGTSYVQKQLQITTLSIYGTPLNQQQFAQVIKLLSTCLQLTGLSLCDCHLNDFTAIKNLSKLKRLRMLYVESNLINDLTPISHLSYLTLLGINRNPIDSKNLSTLIKDTKINKLYAGDCQLNNLDFLTQSEHLTQVYLRGNEITTIPQWLVEPTASSSSNSTPFAITFDDGEFHKTAKTKKVILLRNNPITTPPIEIAQRGNEAILNYYQQLESQTEKDHLFEAKMLIVGEPGAGKTSLARKINDPQAALPKEADTTHGIDVLDYQFKIHQQDFPNYQGEQSIEGKTFTTNLWDFGGQKIYLATHRFFLSNRALYVLISDSRTENTDFNYWLHVVEMFSPHSPILIILNEKEQRQHQFDPSLLKSRFNNIVDVQAVDLKSENYQQLNDVRHVIRHHISKLPHVGSPLPGSWLEVRDKLNSIKAPNIRPDQYLDICTDAGIDNKTDAMQLSQYFHDIGVFLHFQHDEVLKNTIFLDSNWTTNTIYALLDDKSVFNNRGIISKKQAMDIWRQDAVNDKCDEFFRLMKVFHLAFEFKNSGKYIVPAKLPFASEEQLRLEPTGTNIQLGYKYNEFMPRGLLFNLMVELQHLITDKSKIWQQAAIFFKDSYQGNSRALVTEDHYSRTINLNIVGDIGGNSPRDLLVIIMDKLDEINRQYQKLKVTKQIPCICAECKVADKPHFYGYDILQRRQQKGKTTIECEKSYEDVKVSELLAQVASNGSSYTVSKSVTSTNRNQIFISYSHNDAAIFERVKVHFKGLNHADKDFIYWEDTQIKPGQKWFDAIKNNLASCKVAVLLISADFLASNFIQHHELPDIFAAMNDEGISVIPVLVGPCSQKAQASISDFQFINSMEKPLKNLPEGEQDEYLAKLTDSVVEAMGLAFS